MIGIATESIVSIYSDIMAFLLVLGLLYMVRRYKVGHDEHTDKIFVRLCVVTLINAVSNAICYALHYQTPGWPLMVRMIFPTIAEITVLYILFLWVVYMDYKLFASWERVISLRQYLFAPVLLFTVFAVLNLFSGIMFSVEENMIFVRKPLFDAMTIVEYLYGVIASVAVVHYSKTNGRIHFFHILPIVVPAIVANVFTLMTEYSARSFGFAVALVFLHFSYISRWRFEDVESGFYNKQYMGYIYELIRAGKKDYRGITEISADRMEPVVFNMVKAEIPKEDQVIRISDKKLLILTESSKISALTMYSELIKDAAREYEEKFTEEAPLGLTVSNHTAEKSESSYDFVKRIVQA